MPCFHFVSVRSFARLVSIKNFASLTGLAIFYAIEIASVQSGRKYLSKVRDTQKRDNNQA